MYFQKLAEKTLYSEINGETTADGLPLVEISLEYSFRTPGEERKYEEVRFCQRNSLSSY